MAANAQPAEKVEDLRSNIDPGIKSERYSNTLEFWKRTSLGLLPGDPELATCLKHLSEFFSDKFKTTSNLEDLDTAAKFCIAAVSGTTGGHHTLPGMHQDLAVFFFSRYGVTNDLGDLGASVRHSLTAIATTPEGDPNLPGMYSHLGTTYRVRYKRVGDKKDQKSALDYNQAAVAAIPLGHPSLPSMIFNLAEATRDRYYFSGGGKKDLESILKFFQAAIAGTPAGDPTLPTMHQTLGFSYSDRYHRYRELCDLDAEVIHFKAAVSGTPEGHSGLPRMCQNLGYAYLARYEVTGELQDMGAALEYSLQAVTATPKGSPNLPLIQQNLGKTYSDRYRKTGQMEDLEAALKYQSAAMSATLAGDPGFSSMQHSLGESYNDKYKRTGDIQDLDTALKYHIAAVAGTYEGHPGFASMQQSLGICYNDRYKRTGNLEDLDASLKYLKAAVAATPKNAPTLTAMYQNLGACHGDRYQRIGDVEDLDAALRSFLAAVDRLPQDHPYLPGLYQSLGACHGNRYQSLGEIQDIEAALDYNLKAVAGTPKGSILLPQMYQDLGLTYGQKYERVGDLKDLEAALKYQAAAVAEIPADHPDLPSMHQDLGTSYFVRYKRIGNMQDLDAALEHHLAAITGTPEGHPSLHVRQRSLGASHGDRYHRTGDLKDLEASLHYFLAAVAGTPEGHPELPAMHEGLGVCYISRYSELSDPQDLQASLKYHLAAIAGTPEGYSSVPAMYHAMGVACGVGYKKTGESQYLEDALKYHQVAVDTTPETHPVLAKRQSRLANSYALKYDMSSTLEDLNKAYSLYKSASQSHTAPPQLIWDISVEFTHKTKYFTVHQILEGYTTALAVLPSVLWLGSPLRNRHDTLINKGVSSFISNAVTTALEVGDIRMAVEFLEQGLSTTHKQTLQLRDEHAALQASLPVLSEKLHDVSAQLQGSSYALNPGANYHELAYERQQLIAQIREHSGFEDFLIAPKYPKLCAAAQNGPVIMLNYTVAQTDAFIIMNPKSPPHHLPLPGVKALDVRHHQELLKTGLQLLRIHSRNKDSSGVHQPQDDQQVAWKSLHAVTTWLWTSVVKPVFDLLAKNQVHSGRLWWCPSGPFTYLPLHAAAPVNRNFIQSYIPTLEILINVTAKQKSVYGNNLLTAVGVSKTLVVPEDGTWAEIPSVEQELSSVTKVFGPESQQLQGSQALTVDVVKAIKSSSWLHLACHGEQDTADPLQSGLILHEEKLSLGQILNIDLDNAKFVYLSACETAMGDGQLPNEAMHLAGGFLSAGYQGAIGTLWNMTDSDGPAVAEMVYQTILGEDNVPDVTMAAEGLHLAIQKLRKAHVPRYRWMPFVHFGI